MSAAIRPVIEDEFAEFLAVTAAAFGSPPDPAEDEVTREVLARDRTLACFHDAPDGRACIVGTAAALSFPLAVPGGELPVAGVTAVGVLPTHRRRGVLTALMRRQLVDIAARGEPLAVLFASEPGIYRRYGYGPAACALALTIPRAGAAMLGPADPGRLTLHQASEVGPELSTVYAGLQPGRAGHYRRDEDGWRLRLFDPPGRRHGATALQAVLHSDGGRPDGYALYRCRGRFRDAQPDGEVTVVEVLAGEPAGYAALWRYLLSLDLMARTSVVVVPDDPILTLLVDPYAAAPRLCANLWVRLVDMPAALAGRRYAGPVDLTLEVTDELLPANGGRWRLQANPGRGPAPTCRRTDAEPDLALDTDALATAYLGGPSLSALAATGQVRVLRPEVLPAASTAFGWDRAPFCPQLF